MYSLSFTNVNVYTAVDLSYTAVDLVRSNGKKPPLCPLRAPPSNGPLCAHARPTNEDPPGTSTNGSIRDQFTSQATGVNHTRREPYGELDRDLKGLYTF